MKKRYHIVRQNGVVHCFVEHQEAERLLWTRDYALENIGLHSPDGFEIGYGGSGPSDLALTILCDFYGVAANKDLFMKFQVSDAMKSVWTHHQAVKRAFIQPHQNMVDITSDELMEFIAEEETDVSESGDDRAAG
jgi:hypothetical protein